MLIEFAIRPNNDARLRDVQASWNNWMSSSGATLVDGATLLIVHTNHEYHDLDRWSELDRSGGGVLFVTGAPREELASLQKHRPDWPPRWHVLTTPISGATASAELHGRFARFLTSCAGLSRGDAIPWDCLYSLALSENVLSIYLWCLAQPLLIKNAIAAPAELWRIGDDALRDLRVLENERRLEKAPVRSEMNKCLELNSEACEAFVRWVKTVLLPSLA